MKNPRFKNYIYWGTTALAVIALSVAFGFFLSRFELVSGALGKIASILMPIIYGAVLAYLMLPIYNKTRACTTLKLKTVMKSESAIGKLAKTAGTLVSLIVLFAIVAGLFSMIIPQIYTSIIGLQESIGEYINNLTLWMTKLFEDNPDVQQAVMPYYEQAVEEFQKWLTEKLVPNMSMIIGQLSTGLLNVVTVVKNILIGVIVMVYFLNIKDTLAAQSKKIIYSVFKLKEANRIVSEVRFAHGVFGGFITGKLLDSLIIGIMCFFALKFLKMPYVLLISVIIGVTNVIPFFGPFIGAIPSAFLILLVSPVKCLYFLIFILILQQFDGNILGPKILGDSTGLPSFWVLFSILLFGGLMGFVGMIIGVPTFAVIYRLTSMYVSNSLVKKDLSSRTEDYLRLDHIDEEEKIYIDRDIQE
ncbi:pheromone autoinducer 2 transporter [uncultured Clostridium sp.]|nr:pheromone autoinducer 2 transporter [uncultured Clostridium sp.]